MRAKIFALAAALAMLASELFLGTMRAQAATFFPVLQAGDVFSGLIYVNPTTPLSPDNPNPDGTHIYASPPEFGFVAVNIPGGTFLGSASVVYVRPGSDGLTRWFMGTQSGTFNGISLPLSIMSVILYGSTASTSILPDLPSYTFGDSLSYSNIQLAVRSPDGRQALTYFGLLTSLIQVDAAPGLFSFDGTIYIPPQPPPGPISTPLPAALPLFAAGLGIMGNARLAEETQRFVFEGYP